MKRLFLIALFLLSACSLFEPPFKSGAEGGDVHYICDSNRTIVVRYKPNGVILEYEGVKHRLKYIRSTSGARYVGDTLIWWNNGSENLLYQREDESLIENCHQPN